MKLHMMTVIGAAVLAVAALSACSTTRETYKAAVDPQYCDSNVETETPTCLENLARVLTEHYSSTVEEAANYKERGGNPAVVAKLQAADNRGSAAV